MSCFRVIRHTLVRLSVTLKLFNMPFEISFVYVQSKNKPLYYLSFAACVLRECLQKCLQDTDTDLFISGKKQIKRAEAAGR